MHKAGYVNIIGAPNVGKSTLMNAFLGENLMAVAPKAQTTRHRILGLVNDDDFQIVLSDTPGLLKPAYALQQSMMDAAVSVFEDADILLLVVEAGQKQLGYEDIEKRLQTTETPLLLLINKIDLTDQAALEEDFDRWQETFPKAEVFPVSALNGFGLEPLRARILKLLPESPPFFPKDQISDRDDRFFAEEMVRESILNHYQKEIPYSVQVEVQEFKDEENILKIRANIYTERPTQKGILVGNKGAAITKMGTAARQRMEKFYGKKVFLDLFVKVRKDWRKNEAELKRFGYKK